MLILAGLWLTSSLDTYAQARVTGIVTCADTGGPGRFVAIRLISQGSEFHGVGRVVFGQTDINGHFSIPSVPKGRYYADASLQGYFGPEKGRELAAIETLKQTPSEAEKAGRVIITVADLNISDVKIVLSRGGEVTGNVRFLDGTPAIGAEVTALLSIAHDDQPGSIIAQSAVTYTDDRGKYRLAGIPPGEWIVRVELPEGQAGLQIYPTYSGNTIHRSQAIAFLSKEGVATTFDISIGSVDGHHLAGIMKRGDAAVKANEIILLRDRSGELPPLATLTNDVGRFEFPLVIPGDFDLVDGGRRSSVSGTPVTVGKEDINDIIYAE